MNATRRSGGLRPSLLKKHRIEEANGAKSSWPAQPAGFRAGEPAGFRAVMPGAGLEPARPQGGHPILSRARITSFATPAGSE
jgi:hypothetical protein